MNHPAGEVLTGLSSFIDERTVAVEHQAEVERQKREERWAWSDENKWILERLRQHTDNLDFEGMADVAREQFRRLRYFRDEKMAVHKVNWLPDDSDEFRNGPGPKLRAITGETLLLSRSGAVDDWRSGCVKYDEAFSVLGVAIQDGSSIAYMKIAIDDRESVANCFYVWVENTRYQLAAGSARGTIDQYAGSPDKYERAEQEYLKDIARAKTEVVYGDAEQTGYLSHILLDEATRKEGTDKHLLTPLVDVNYALDQYDVAQAFNTFLTENPGVQWMVNERHALPAV